MSVFRTLRAALRRMPRGYPADGRRLRLGLATAMDAQRARGAEPMDASATRLPDTSNHRHTPAR